MYADRPTTKKAEKEMSACHATSDSLGLWIFDNDI
jgi:hypothetical protein